MSFIHLFIGECFQIRSNEYFPCNIVTCCLKNEAALTDEDSKKEVKSPYQTLLG